MADRAGVWGREYAVVNSAAAADDGRMSFADLCGKGATKMPKDDADTYALVQFGGGHTPIIADDNRVQDDCFDERPPSVAGDDPSDEDPFGHIGLGFDTAEGGPLGNPGVGQSSPEVDAVVPPLAVRWGNEVAHLSHRLRRNAQVVWCIDCGRFAVSRLGVGLTRACRGVADGSYAARLRRLSSGLHPMTGESI